MAMKMMKMTVMMMMMTMMMIFYTDIGEPSNQEYIQGLFGARGCPALNGAAAPWAWP